LTEPLFDHLEEIRKEIAAAHHFALFLDFDGTLAPIVQHPGEAKIPPKTRRVLEGIVERPDVTVAVISGRALEDLRVRVGMDVILAGNHGLEIGGRGLDFREPKAQQRRVMLGEICAELRKLSRSIEGAEIEDKGLSGSVHFRNVAAADVSRLAAVVRAVVSPHGNQFVIRQGIKVFEIVPCVRWNKGLAVRWILDQLRGFPDERICYCYIGDDVTDEDAFRELAEGITIQVAGKTATAARFRARDTAETRAFLDWLKDTHASAERPITSGNVDPQIANRV
jgi:trehalose 6-phosphate phosphatase